MAIFKSVLSMLAVGFIAFVLLTIICDKPNFERLSWSNLRTWAVLSLVFIVYCFSLRERSR